MASRVILVLLWTHGASKVGFLIFSEATAIVERVYYLGSLLSTCELAALSETIFAFLYITPHRIDPEEWHLFWLPKGILAISALSLLVLVSLRPIRAKSYELFFWIHFLLVL